MLFPKDRHQTSRAARINTDSSQQIPPPPLPPQEHRVKVEILPVLSRYNSKSQDLTLKMPNSPPDVLHDRQGLMTSPITLSLYFNSNQLCH